MKPPKTVKVLGQSVSVQMMSEVHGDETNKDGWTKPVAADGLTDSSAGIIGIRTGLGFGKEREVVVHEVLHVAVNLAGLNHDVLTNGRDERVVKRLSPILLEVLRSNPRLIAYLAEPER